jgi:hypothetical protein
MFPLVLTAQTGQTSLDRFPGAIPIPRLDTREPSAMERVKGVILGLNAGSLDLEVADTRILPIRIVPTTTKPVDLKAGDGADVVAEKDQKGFLQAVSIKVNPKIARTMESSQIEAGPKERRRATLPTILVRPAAAQVSSARPAPADSPPDLIEQARASASTFLEGLPNYFCQETITRYVAETRKPNWNVVDVVSAALVFEDRNESYRNVVINGKPSKKSPEESGVWSSGEFGTILDYLFSPGAAAGFKYAEAGRIEQLPASIYDFQVARRHSAWRIEVPGQYILPGYQGSVWIDPRSAHTLRIEMQAQDIPKAFPRLTVETAVDYDYITLGTPEKFLLPVHAEVLSCSRASNQCERNVIEFRNYHKFTGESTIQFNP